MSEFIHLPASGCLGNTVLSPERSRLERFCLDSGSSASQGMKSQLQGKGDREQQRPLSSRQRPRMLVPVRSPGGAFPSAV